MIRDIHAHEIIHCGKNGCVTYDGTLESVMCLVEATVARWPALAAVRRACRVLHLGAAVRPKGWLTTVLSEVLDTPVGQPLPHLTRLHYGRSLEAHELPLKQVQAYRKELCLWCFNNRITPEKLVTLPVSDLVAMRPIANLSFLRVVAARYPAGITLVEDKLLAAVIELEVLRRGQWQQHARESRVIRRYLRFLREWAPGEWRIAPKNEDLREAA